MSDETVEPTSEDASGTSDALAAFVADDDPKAPENQPLPRAKDAPQRRKPVEAKEEPEEWTPATAKKEEVADDDKGEDKEPPKPEKRVYKHKVLGEERELDADQLDSIAKSIGVEPRELLSAASLNRASYARMKEAAEARKAIDQARELAARDPISALKALGYAPEQFDQFAQQHVYRRFTQEYDPNTGEPLTQEQRELAHFRATEAQRAEQEKAAADRLKSEEEHRTQSEQERHWVKTIVSHLEKSGDPKSLLARVAQHLGDAVETDAGTDPADILDDAVSLAWDDVKAEHAKLYEAMPYETLKAQLPTLVEKVRKGIVSDWKAKSGQAAPERQPEPIRRDYVRKTRTTGDVLADFVRGR
jgi:hypothetical protein